MKTTLLGTRNYGEIFPVGYIYISASQVNPSTYFGGTWEQIKDVFLLSAGDTYTAGSMGGEATHKLTWNEMPKHSHEQYVSANSGSEAIRHDFSRDAGGSKYPQGCNTGIAGNDQPHNNMPPYLTVYMYKRIA